MPLVPVPPTDTRRFFRPVASELTALLRRLPAEAWDRPTVAGTWRVRDVVAHLVDVSMRRLSFHRDRHMPPAPAHPLRTERDFVSFTNGLNGQWIEAARRISPRLLADWYEFVAAALADFTESFPDDGPALFAVSWAGEERSDGWFDLGREFTEHWHHQAQVRDAVMASPLSDPAWLHAVLLIALRGLPHAFRDTPVETGRALTIEVTGTAGGVWTLRGDTDGWTLWAGQDGSETARATMSDDTAWKLLFNALPADRADRLVTRSGDPVLFGPLLRARSVIV
jgi:uncharacterized protein (TIGR03083 family)